MCSGRMAADLKRLNLDGQAYVDHRLQLAVLSRKIVCKRQANFAK